MNTVMVILVPEKGLWQSPPERRLARLLKAMLRGYGFRCIAVRELRGKRSHP